MHQGGESAVIQERNEPRVSIVIPAFNVEKWIFESISSALGQTYANFEVIVVDDGSSDETLKIATQFTDEIVLIRNKKNLGACAARNHGIAASTGSYVQFWDADDIMARDCLTKKIEKLSMAEEKNVLIASDLRLMPESGDTSKSKPWPFSYQLEEILRYGGPATSAALYPKWMLQTIGGFREDLPCAQDYDLNLRIMILCDSMFVQNHHVGGYIREREGSLSRSAGDRLPKTKLKVLEHAKGLLQSSDRMDKSCNRALAQHFYAIAIHLWRLGEREDGRRLAKQAKAMDSKCHNTCYSSGLQEFFAGVAGFEKVERVRSFLKRFSA